jgi:hypothetical protein
MEPEGKNAYFAVARIGQLADAGDEGIGESNGVEKGRDGDAAAANGESRTSTNDAEATGIANSRSFGPVYGRGR